MTGLGAAVNLVLNVALIPRHGMMGAAVATVAAYATMAVGMAWWAQRVYPVPYQWRRVGIAAFIAVVLAVAVKLLEGGIAVALLAILLYPLALLASGFTEPAERKRLRAVVRR